MRHRSKATLGLILPGLLAAALTPAVAPAQQSAAPAATSAPAKAPSGTTQDAARKTGSAPADPSQAQDTSTSSTQTGTSNPDAVTPDTSTANSDESRHPTAAPAPAQDDDAKPAGPSESTAPQAGKSSGFPAAVAADPSTITPETTNEQRFAPDEPPAPLTPDHDSDKPTPPDPAPSSASPQSTPPAASAPAPTAASETSTTSTPANAPSAADSTAPAPGIAAQADAPQQTAPAAPPADTTTPAAAPDSTSQQTAPSTPPADTAVPPAAAPPQSSAPASPAQTTPDQSAPATAPVPAATAPAPPSPENPPATAPESGAAPSTSALSDAAPAPQDQAPAPADNAAVNPSLPAPQVNEPEPPPASRVDLFGGYTYLRPNGSVGTWSFPAQNTRGYIAGGSYYFRRHFGVQAEFQHSEYPLGTTGASPAPPFVQLGGITDSFTTIEAGPVYRFFLGEHLIPFVHFTGGGAKVAGPKFQPPTWGYGFAGGGGLDVLLPHTHEHVAFRLVQADYGYMHADQGALQEYDLAGGTESVDALRLSAGLVFRFGEMNTIPAKSLACDASPAEVYSGERVTLAATLRNYRDKTKHPFAFSWELQAGKQQGFGPVIFVDTTGLAAGTYHATAHIALKEKGKQFAQCSASFTVKESPAPTVKCSPDPSTVTPGQVSTITAYAGSIAQRQLTYSYTASEGQIAGKDNTAELHTDGLPPGMATVTCQVQDDLGRTAVATTEVTIAPPALPPAPKAQPLCTVYFNRDMRRPARVDNEGRACLDDVALTMEHQPDARLVLVGEHSDSEVDGQLTAAERAMNTRAYLANEKGIDPSRVDVRTSTTPGRQVQTYLLAPGAVFDQPTEGRIDESKIKIHGQQYARQKMRPAQKGPVGEGVSHPPKN